MKLRSGETITLKIPGFDQVELIEELGSGGDGHVWQVKPVSPGEAEFYVLKSICLDPELNDEQRADHIRRIRREASVFVDSAYIIKCLGLCEIERDHFVLLFPYEPGGNLEEWIREQSACPLSRKKALFLKILDGVQALHQAQIIHRDLKPKNILVVLPDETPRIFDFGLAKFRNRESVTEVGTIAGTDAYIAPEVFGWGGIKAVDERCDIYALGIILYELIVGKNPWRANGWKFGDFADYLQKQNRDGGKSAFSHILQIDDKFSCIDGPATKAIEYATMFEPERRFHSVEQLRQAVQGIFLNAPQHRLIDYMPHDGDTFEITQQALSHEQDTPQSVRHSPIMAEQIDLNEPGTPDNAPPNPPKALPKSLSTPRNAPPKPPIASNLKNSPTPKAQKESSGCWWLIILVVGLLALFLGGLGVGAWGIYRWWNGRHPIQIVATPTPKPRSTPTPPTQPVKRSTATPIPRPKSTSTPTPRPKPTSTPQPAPTRTPTPRPRPTVTPTASPTNTPIPSPTPTPLHGLDQQAVNELQKILDVEDSSAPETTDTPEDTPPPVHTATPSPTATPTPTMTPTPEQGEEVNPDVLKDLLHQGE